GRIRPWFPDDGQPSSSRPAPGRRLCGFPVLAVKFVRIPPCDGPLCADFARSHARLSSWLVEQGNPDNPPTAERRPMSRAPLYVVLGFFVIAITLVLIGAMRSSEKPNPQPSVLQPGTVDAPRAVTVIMRDYLFEPNPLALVPGETIRLTAFDA